MQKTNLNNNSGAFDDLKSSDEVLIKNKNRVENRTVPAYQNEYDRLGVVPNKPGGSLLPTKSATPKTASSNANADSRFLISKMSKKQDSYNYESESPGLPFKKAPSNEMWATLDGEISWEADDSDSEVIIEKKAPEKFIDNNDYVDMGESQSENFSTSENSINQIETDKYLLFVKNKLLLTDATEQDVQKLIESIIYGEHKDFQNVDLKSTDFSVFKKMELYFGAYIVK